MATSSRIRPKRSAPVGQEAQEKKTTLARPRVRVRPARGVEEPVKPVELIPVRTETPPEREVVHSWSDRVDYDAIIQNYKSKATSYKTAIRSHCVDCMGGLVQSIKDCTSYDCSLYPFRMGENPYDARTVKAREKKEG
ncbi:hypothetical protein FDG94_gp123 [Pseudomonas phage SM1]|uniref:Uncharacterized protein n=2 Tax=Samunavirus TaxID=2560221 RepID=A0A0U3CCB6_9CAUD|nr:hypothetical protein FDG94_gp123 [Pseudomonas phage SM1]ALT58115.1 hypothetical protein SM1_0123 [Pseudomonas phage SM1]WDS62449.1 membrane protein [Pseudomonas phage UF_RH6]